MEGGKRHQKLKWRKKYSQNFQKNERSEKLSEQTIAITKDR